MSYPEFRISTLPHMTKSVIFERKSKEEVSILGYKLTDVRFTHSWMSQIIEALNEKESLIFERKIKVKNISKEDIQTVLKEKSYSKF